MESGDSFRINPYKAPTARLSAEPDLEERLPVVAAARWRRFLNFVIDYACVVVLMFGLVMLYGVIWIWMLNADPGRSVLDDLLAVYFYKSLVALVYYCGMEAAFGATIGKLITGTCVVNEQGGKPRFRQILGRSLARFIPFEVFSVWLSDDDVRRGWHDWLSKTVVVRNR